MGHPNDHDQLARDQERLNLEGSRCSKLVRMPQEQRRHLHWTSYAIGFAKAPCVIC
jgi:hypothetical protein